ncbi:hypothetical protein KJ819_01240 [Patescibacteria group bacterium]|nr:hypothetical protein [Patescibacteria group bacterium]MBU1500567.1 hypothetical protein [Patescibacteria group bacterium]MBU2080464.1 hypothetical protein [Patescibacteria group bacterium]MBU2123731.1 hypothetical protein [Patescibacteria group bacterium]MBU2194587.1 hypothetical protein [Patescibacteria group bacterium]
MQDSLNSLWNTVGEWGTSSEGFAIIIGCTVLLVAYAHFKNARTWKAQNSGVRARFSKRNAFKLLMSGIVLFVSSIGGLLFVQRLHSVLNSNTPVPLSGHVLLLGGLGFVGLMLVGFSLWLLARSE